MTSIHTWTPEQRRELMSIVDLKAAELRNDPDLVGYLTATLRLAGLPDTADMHKAVILGAVLHSIGNDDL